jgi:hypothetical protein
MTWPVQQYRADGLCRVTPPLGRGVSDAGRAQDDAGDVRVVGRGVDARLDRVRFDREVVAEQPGEVVRTDVVRRVDASRLRVLAVFVAEVVVDGEQQPAGAQWRSD